MDRAGTIQALRDAAILLMLIVLVLSVRIGATEEASPASPSRPVNAGLMVPATARDLEMIDPLPATDPPASWAAPRAARSIDEALSSEIRLPGGTRLVIVLGDGEADLGASEPEVRALREVTVQRAALPDC